MIFKKSIDLKHEFNQAVLNQHTLIPGGVSFGTTQLHFFFKSIPVIFKNEAPLSISSNTVKTYIKV